MQTDRQLIAEHLDRIFGNAESGNIVLWEQYTDRPNKFTMVVPLSERAVLVNRLAEQPAETHVYVGLALFDDIALANQTRKNETVSSINLVAFDLDLATGEHASDKYPTDAEQALRLLKESGLPEPSYIVHSGGGLYPHWQFDAPFLISDPESRSRAASFLKGFRAKAVETWTRHGLILDPTMDLARLLRVPGTFNPKYDPPRSVVFLSPDKGVRYSFEDLEAFVPKAVPHKKSQSAPSSLRKLLERQARGVDGDATRERASAALAMMNACEFVDHCDREAGSLTEPLWKHLADVFAHIEGGDEYFHKASERHPSYNFLQAKSKIDRAKQFGPKSCDRISEDFAGCEGCIFRKMQLAKTPAQLTRNHPGLAKLQKRYILDSKSGLYFDTVTDKAKSWKDFDRSYSRDMYMDRDASKAFVRGDFSPIVAEHDYLPGNPSSIIDLGGDEYAYNVWKSGGANAVEGDPSLWLDHITFLVPDEEPRQWLLQYMAHLVQKQGVKIKSGVLLQSDQGVGKSILMEAFQKLFHPNDSKQLYGSILTERWQADLGNLTFAVLDELQVNELANSYNRTKRWATEEYQMVERKGVDPYPVRTPRGMFILTNHDVPMKFERDDRRFLVVKIKSRKLRNEYYGKLMTEGMSAETLGAFKAHLSSLDLSSFNPNAEPPFTAAKAELINASKPLLEQIIDEMRHDEVGPFAKPIYLIEDVVNTVAERMRRPITAQHITPILQKLGDGKSDRKVSIGRSALRANSRPYLWAWKNVDYWLNIAGDDDIRSQLLTNNHLGMVRNQPSGDNANVQLSS